ncbi:hypothetical protein QBC40DRAFT_319912 [Triangularia verruculosa]|uniref:Uncharacterized protein n=1 Tax=Triangularia verruculosa TaxID=2587418 RepID=A0AAN7AQ43_9PEZI|nr:hypothetical protein QBC40DRAFT_319912 [Triangularia verruculosa]
MTLSTEAKGINGHAVNGNGVHGHDPDTFTLKDAPVENLRPLRVIVVGAGFSGILAAIRIPERLRNVELVVYEKADGVGGVWHANRYPGVACDVPSYSYQYTFAPNPNWSALYAPGSEIRQYLEGVATRFGAMRFIKLNHRVEGGEWDSVTKKWNVKVHNISTGETFHDSANILVTARGQLSEPSWPSIPGLDTFTGKTMHSGVWDTSYDFTNKRIGVIGNGSSAIQIIPQLQKVPGTQLKCFMRSPTWISPEFGDQGMEELGFDPKATTFSEEQKSTLRADPELFLKFRKVFEDLGNTIQSTTILSHPDQVSSQSFFHSSMTTKLSTRPDLRSLLIPTFAPGCRRVTPGPGFLESLLKPNVAVIPDPITSITPTGISTTAPSTTTHEFDAIICATGFAVGQAPPFPLLGRDSTPLTEHWSSFPQTYLSMTTSNFPNLFFLFGPNSAIGFGSLTKILEALVDYLCQYIRKMQKEDYASMEPKPERVADFEEYTKTYFENTVYMDKCSSWYRKGDRVVGLWPGSTLHALEALRAPRWEDYDFETVGGRGGNKLGWLGNGWSVTQMKGQKYGGDPSWYLNPDEVEIPVEGRPEENEKWGRRPWSH